EPLRLDDVRVVRGMGEPQWRERECERRDERGGLRAREIPTEQVGRCCGERKTQKDDEIVGGDRIEDAREQPAGAIRDRLRERRRRAARPELLNHRIRVVVTAGDLVAIDDLGGRSQDRPGRYDGRHGGDPYREREAADHRLSPRVTTRTDTWVAPSAAVNRS